MVAADHDEELALIAQEMGTEVIPGLSGIKGAREDLPLKIWTYKRFFGK